MSEVLERFLKYVKYDTRSDEESASCPSSSKQLVLARDLVIELKELGMKDVSLDEHGYVMATLPSNTDKQTPVVGFIAHMDTSPEMSDTNVMPKIVNYNGGDIVLNSVQNIILSPSDFPELNDYKGKDIITTDGTTLLGADDKAGIAEIVSAVEYLIMHPEIKHGTIKVAFTPDEEVGRGADHFDVKKFGADLAYTMDGGPVGELEYENFNAAAAKISISGVNIHPGSAKGRMKNSMLVANELMSMFPSDEIPANTEEYEGFYHLVSIKGDIEKTDLYYIIRDFDRENFKLRKEFVERSVKSLNEKYGSDTIKLALKDQYYNMKEEIQKVMYVVDNASSAIKAVGITPIIRPIRGGTDGARLSFMGLPTPNIFTGGHNFHGRYEFIPVFAMEKAVEVILKIIELYANN